MNVDQQGNKKKLLLKMNQGKQSFCGSKRDMTAVPLTGVTMSLLYAAMTVLFFVAGFLGLMFPGTVLADTYASVSTWPQMQNAVSKRVSGTVYITVTEDLTISGGNAHNSGNTVVIDMQNHTIDGNKSQQAFWNESGTLTIQNGTIRNCKTDRGGAINNRTELRLENVVITDCIGNIEAGGIMNYGTLTMTGGKITNCLGSRGGGIRIRPFNSGREAIATLTNVEISNNQADGRQDSGDGRYGRGGGIALSNAALTMTGCTVSRNRSTDDDGGGLDFDASGKTLTLINTVFSENQVTQSDREGGGVNLERGSAVISECTFTGNIATGDGGAINIAKTFGTAELTDTAITGNTSRDHSGGGIMNKAALTLKGTNTITGNTAREQGAGIYFSSDAKSLNIEGNLRISDNELSNGYPKNLYLPQNKKLNITGELDNSALIGVSPDNLSMTAVVITSGAGAKASMDNFENDDHWYKRVNNAGEIEMWMGAPLSGDVLDRATVSFHPQNQHSGLCIRDNGGGAGQNVVQLYNLGDSFRFWLTKADEDSYYIDFFGGADDYNPSNKRLDLSDNDGYGNVGNVVHVVMGDKTATNKRWRFYQNGDGTYYIQNKRSGLFWALEDSNYDDKNKLCQKRIASAQKWQMEIVHADAISGAPIDDQEKLKEIKPYDSFCFSYEGHNVQGNNWMSCLPDDLLITDVTIPGAHDAGTQHTWDFNDTAQCQQLSIMDMLTSGVRYFDLRTGNRTPPATGGDDTMMIVHGMAFCVYKGDKLLIKDVMQWIYNFLDENPGETVIIQPMPMPQLGETYDLHQIAYQYFRDEVKEKPERYYIGNHVPTLREVRGKILIISRIKEAFDSDFKKKDAVGNLYPEGKQWALTASVWRDWSGDYDDPLRVTNEGNDYVIFTQDKFDTYGDDKWQISVNSIFNRKSGAAAKNAKAKANGRNAWVISYTSCVRTYPQNAARDQNQRLKTKLMTDPNVLAGQYLGVVCSDFTDQQLAYLVYKQNFITKQESSEHTEHTPETREISTTATCTQPGTRVVETYCSVCGQILSTVSETIPALGHNWSDPEYTWEKAGNTYRVTARHFCDRDNSHTESETVQAAFAGSVAATCERAGGRNWVATFSKEDFGDAGMMEEIPALGHDWGEWEVVRAATTKAEGLERRVCQHDPTHVEENVIPKLTPSASVYLVLQAADGSWPEPGQPYGTALGSFMPGPIPHYTVSGYSTAFRETESGRTAATGGTAVEISANADKLYIYYSRTTCDLVFMRDIAGTTVWKTEKVRWGAPLSTFGSKGFSAGERFPAPADHTLSGWTLTPKTSGKYSLLNIVPDEDPVRPKSEEEKQRYPYVLYDFSGAMPTGTMKLYPVLIPDQLEVHLDLGSYDQVIMNSTPGTYNWYDRVKYSQQPYAGTPASMDESQSRLFTADLNEKLLPDTMNAMLAATRTGYTLNGWYTKGNVKWDKEMAVIPEWCDGTVQSIEYGQLHFKLYTLTLTARWDPKSIQVTYDKGLYAADGSPEIPGGTAVMGGRIAFPVGPAAQSGYRFTGWKDKNGTVHKEPEMRLNDLSLIDSGTIRFTAQYEEVPETEENAHTVSFYSENRVFLASISKAKGEKINDSDWNSADWFTTFSQGRAGNTFAGWKQNGTDVTWPYTMGDQNIELTASWTPNSYKITFYNGSEKFADIQKTYGVSLAKSDFPADPQRPGYDFSGWIDDEDQPVSFPFTVPARNVSLYAIWSPKNVTVTFNANGGHFADNSTIFTVQGVNGSPFVIPPVPVYGNKVFFGWSSNNATNTPLPLTMPGENMTYWARWHDHTQEEPVRENEIPVTCEEDGSYDSVIYCSFCHQELSREHLSIPKTGHSWGDWMRLNGNQHVRFCRHDSTHRETADHIWGEKTVTKAPSCSETGLMTITCSGCGAVKTQVLSMTEHIWVEDNANSREPTCTEAGSQSWKCLNCRAVRTETEPATGHTWDEGTETVAPTCESAGVRTLHCTNANCNAIQTEAIAPLGHEWDSWMVSEQASDRENGLEISLCRRDASHRQMQVIPRMIVSPPRTVNGLVFTGAPQALVTPGTTTGGEMQYTLGNETEAQTMGWSSNLTTGTQAGTYYTWYRVQGDDRYRHLLPANPVRTIISGEAFIYTVYRVENGTHWIRDGKDTVVTVRRSVQDELSYVRFRQVLLDGSVVNPAVYSTKQGSLILTLKSEWLDSLAVGEHVLRIDFSDGSAETTLTIRDDVAGAVPETGDRANLLLWIALVLANAIGIGACMFRPKRSQQG